MRLTWERLPGKHGDTEKTFILAKGQLKNVVYQHSCLYTVGGTRAPTEISHMIRENMQTVQKVLILAPCSLHSAEPIIKIHFSFHVSLY